MKTFYLLIIVFFTSLVAISQDFTPLHIKFRVSPEIDINHIKTFAKVYKIQNDTAFAIVDEPGFYSFKKLNYKFKVIPDPIIATKALTMATTVADMASWNRYPTHDVYKQMMQNFATAYPNICKLDTIGFSVNGRPILVVRISDNVNTDEDEPEFFYTGQMHGDEIVDYIMFLHLIDYMLTNYGTDAQITNLINNVDIYINPLSNPDGTYDGGDNTISGAIRTNTNNVDLNRDYPDPLGGNLNPSGWATETLGMINFATERNFVVSANTHSGAEVVNYPWDIWTTAENAHADDNWWRYVSLEYAQLAQSLGSSINYMTDVTSNGITEGKDWYEAQGSRQDYMNYYQNCREVTLELSSTKLLNAAVLPNYWNYNRQAMLNYINQVLYGVRGIVTSSCDGTPIEAKVEIVSHDHDNSFVYSSLPIGNYHRPIYAGTYDLIFSAPNYNDVVVSGVVVTNDDITVVNIQMDLNSATIDFEANEQSSCNGNIQFSSSSGGLSNIIWNFGDGTHSTEINPIHNYTESGTYSVTMKYEVCGYSDSLSKTNYININLLPLPTTQNVENCGATSLILTATPNSNGTIYWYDGFNNFLQTGESYTTPVLSSTTSYYVQEKDVLTDANVGLIYNSSTGAYYNDESRYLIFDVFNNVKIKTVKVYAQSAGIRTFVVKNSGGTTIYQSNINLTIGENIVALNWNITPGTNYLIKIDSNNPDLWRSNSGVSFPYQISDVISITNSSAGSGYYYFFYDWVVRYQSNCVSETATITANISTLASANFSYTQNLNEISFVNTSTNATNYLWDFGNGNTSNLENPIHTYSSQGDYIVTLTSTNTCGNSIFTDTIHINTLNINNFDLQIEIYPNPTSNFINLITNTEIKDVSITSIDGKFVQNYVAKNNIIDVYGLKSGMYILQFIINNEIVKRKVVVN